jgi:hypothetical protein
VVAHRKDVCACGWNLKFRNVIMNALPGERGFLDSGVDLACRACPVLGPSASRHRSPLIIIPLSTDTKYF